MANMFKGSVPNVASQVTNKSNNNSSFDAQLRNMSNENTAKTFKFNADQAALNRDWQAMMSDTSHQREVEDLKRAGLNPVLSSNSGAMSYSSSSASGSADTSAVGALASIYMNKKTNETNARIASANRQNELRIAKINERIANRSNLTNREIANVNAAAQKYASDNSFSAAKYNTDVSSSTSRYNAKTNYKSSDYGAIDDTFGKYGKVAKGIYIGTKAFGNIVSSFIGKGKGIYANKSNYGKKR